MSTRIPWRIFAVAIGLAAFAAVFQLAHTRRLQLQPVQDEGTLLIRTALLPRAFAQANGGMWPGLDPRTRTFTLPLNDLPRGYTIAPRFSREMTAPIPAMLLGNINNAAAYTLKPVDTTALSYIYFGYAVTNEKEVQALAKAVREGTPLDEKITVGAGSGTLGSAALYRLCDKLGETLARDGVAPTSDSDILSQFPALMTRPCDGHVWVLYLSTRLERLPFPSTFPATAGVVETLAK